MTSLSDDKKAELERQVIEEYKAELKEKLKKTEDGEKSTIQAVVKPETESHSMKQILTHVFIAGTIFMTFKFIGEMVQRQLQSQTQEEEQQEETQSVEEH